jgi:AraC-like DNA-binding protein/mannose-6-phosphate isomerase-like protein (cupin superfamily)
MTNSLDIKHKEYFISSRAPLGLVRRHPQTEYGLHRHDSNELVIVYEGSGEHYTPNTGYEVKKGDVFVVSGNQEHGYRNTKNLCLINILFEEERIFHPLDDIKDMPGYVALTRVEPKQRANDQFQSRLRLTDAEIKDCMKQVQHVESELSQQKPGWIGELSAELKKVLCFLARRYENRKGHSIYSVIKISEILIYIETHYHETISNARLEKYFEISGSTLLRMFKEATGHAPNEYLIKIRIKKAAELLSRSALTVSEAALRCGFNDNNYFTRIFKRDMGMTPLRWRKSQNIIQH